MLNIQATTDDFAQSGETLERPGERLTPELHSDPPLPTSDIVNLLALGQATESTQYLGEELRRNLHRWAPRHCSPQRVEPTGRAHAEILRDQQLPRRWREEPAESAATRVTVQQQVSHNLTITYSSNVTGGLNK